MEEGDGKIVIYDAYDTVMQANLAKTKLDAYGIPCFLTEENFTSWYPLRNQIFPGVRLHIFEKDSDKVKEVLTESPLGIDATVCPRCNSKNVSIEETEKGKGWYIAITLLFAIISPRKKVYRCHDCKNEWE